MCWRKGSCKSRFSTLTQAKFDPAPSLWQKPHWLQMDLDRVYEPHNIQDVLAACTNVHLFQCHLRHLTNRLSPGGWGRAREANANWKPGLLLLLQSSSSDLGVSQGALPGAALTCLLFISQPRGYPSRGVLLGSAGVGGSSWLPIHALPCWVLTPMAGGGQWWVFICFLDR